MDFDNVIFEKDVGSRTIQTFHYDDSTEKVTIHDQQEVSGIVDYIKRLDNLNVTRDSKARKALNRHVGSIPLNIYNDMRRKWDEQGLSREERDLAFKKWFNGEGA